MSKEPQTPNQLYRDVKSWEEIAYKENFLPDFWDEMETAERLAKYLTGLGYERRI